MSYTRIIAAFYLLAGGLLAASTETRMWDKYPIWVNFSILFIACVLCGIALLIWRARNVNRKRHATIRKICKVTIVTSAVLIWLVLHVVNTSVRFATNEEVEKFRQKMIEKEKEEEQKRRRNALIQLELDNLPKHRF